MESIFGIAAAGAINVGESPHIVIGDGIISPSSFPASTNSGHLAVNYRLKKEDIAYIFDHGDVDVIIVDQEFESLLETYRADHPNIPIIIDTDTDVTEGQLTGPFDDAVLEGLRHDEELGAAGWEALESQAADEDDLIALAYTSGTTARPKGVEYTHRGCYLAALGNVIESGLNYHRGRAGYLWTLPMFHAMGSYILFKLLSFSWGKC